MPQWKKVPKAHQELLERALEAVPEAEKRTMFGCPCWFLNGHMFVAAHQDDIILRLPEADRAELLDRKLATPFAPMKGRVMKEYVALSRAVWGAAGDLRRWVLRSRAYVAALTPKPRKGRK